MPRMYKRPKTSHNISNVPDIAEGDIMEENTTTNTATPQQEQQAEQPEPAEGHDEVVDWKAKFEAQKEINKKLEARGKEDFQSKKTLEERLQQLESEAFKKDVDIIATKYGVPAKLLKGNNSKEVESYAKELASFLEEREATKTPASPTQRFLETTAGRVNVDPKNDHTGLNNLFRTLYRTQ